MLEPEEMTKEELLEEMDADLKRGVDVLIKMMGYLRQMGLIDVTLRTMTSMAEDEEHPERVFIGMAARTALDLTILVKHRRDEVSNG